MKSSRELALIELSFTDALKTRALLKYSVQSADYFQVPVSLEQIAHNRLQKLELFIECDPGERSGRFPTAEAAIEDFDRSFEQTE